VLNCRKFSVIKEEDKLNDSKSELSVSEESNHVPSQDNLFEIPEDKVSDESCSNYNEEADGDNTAKHSNSIFDMKDRMKGVVSMLPVGARNKENGPIFEILRQRKNIRVSSI
jgi:hypothetical protein